MKRKHQLLWKKTRDEWIKQNPPNHAGQWYCIIGGGYLTKETLTLDHDTPRSRDPSRRYDLSNLQPMCWKHNGEKGSRTLQQYLATNPSRRCY